MSKARLIITAVVDEKRAKSEVARDYDVSRYWVQQLVRRYLAEGEAAFEPHSRRPHSSPHAVPAGVEDEIVRLRKELSRQGLDAGADTIRTPWPVALRGRRPRRRPHRPRSRRSGGSWPGADSSPPSRRRDHARPGAGSKPNSPTSAGRPTPLTGSSPTAHR
jgi:hypothetical protein